LLVRGAHTFPSHPYFILF